MGLLELWGHEIAEAGACSYVQFVALFNLVLAASHQVLTFLSLSPYFLYATTKYENWVLKNFTCARFESLRTSLSEGWTYCD